MSGTRRLDCLANGLGKVNSSEGCDRIAGQLVDFLFIVHASLIVGDYDDDLGHWELFR